MKGSTGFKNIIKAHLEQVAAKDPLFAETLKKENKNMDECVNYIISEVQKKKVNVMTDDEVYNMAIHYYDEDSIKGIKAPSGQVDIKHTVDTGNAPVIPIPPTKKAKKVKPIHSVHQSSLF